MTAKITASADGTKVVIGSASEDALQIDTTANTINALAPYTIGMDAANVVVTPVGSVAATDVQAAIAELASEKMQLESGRVLQQKVYTDNGSSHSGTSWTNLVSSQKSITPKSNNSTLLIEVSGQFLVSNLAATNTNAAFGIYESAQGSIIGGGFNLSAPSGAGGVGSTIGGCIRATVSNAALTTRTFGLSGAVGSSSYSLSAAALVITITEIQN